MIKKSIIIILFMLLCASFKADDITVIYSNSKEYCTVKIVQDGLSYTIIDSVNYIILKNNLYYFSNKDHCLCIIPMGNNNLEIIKD